MKVLKITIVAVIVAALGFGIFILFIHPKGKECTDCIDPELIKECDLEFDEHYIDSSYKAIPYGEFQTLSKRRNELEGNYKMIMVDRPEQCRRTVNLMLRNRYRDRFLEMAKHEFEGTEWPHYKEINKLNDALIAELSDNSQELGGIKSNCAKYGELSSFSARVSNQSSQTPSSVTSQWNYSTTKALIEKIPTASSPVNHTTLYEKTRSATVKSKLYEGHVKFLYGLVSLARQYVIDNPTYSSWEYVVNTISKEVELFKDKASSLYGKNYNTVYGVSQDLEKELRKLKDLTTDSTND